MTAKGFLTKYKALPTQERRKVWTFFARAMTQKQDALELAVARRALAEPGPDADWEILKNRLPWNRKRRQQIVTG